jgi:prefoldin alpha subunit
MSIKMTEKQIMQKIQQLQQQIQQQKQYLNNLTNAARDTYLAEEGLKEIEKEPKKTMIDLGAGVLIDVDIKNVKKCKRQIGKNEYKEDTIKKTITWLEKRKNNMEKNIKKVQQEIAKNEQQLSDFISVARQIEAEKKKNFSVK